MLQHPADELIRRSKAQESNTSILSREAPGSIIPEYSNTNKPIASITKIVADMLASNPNTITPELYMFLDADEVIFRAALAGDEAVVNSIIGGELKSIAAHRKACDARALEVKVIFNKIEPGDTYTRIRNGERNPLNDLPRVSPQLRWNENNGMLLEQSEKDLYNIAYIGYTLMDHAWLTSKFRKTFIVSSIPSSMRTTLNRRFSL